MLKQIGWGVLALVGLFALTWLAMGNNFFLYKFFAPKQEAVRRQVFEQSKAYNQGMIQELQNFYVEWAGATPTQKQAIEDVVRHRLSDFPNESIPNHLKGFVDKCRNP